MEAEKTMMMSSSSSSFVREDDDDDDDDDVPLPGFRFHPTDEELVGFYLRRKVEKRPISIELIKHIDIYKYDPWDLPKGSNVGDKEWYFFCKRGRKYRNSIRPNRVTGSGFWKATGIDKPIYSSTTTAANHCCIGLKKSLVYYRGSAGKGTKTDWMMHEFRLPSDHDIISASKTTIAHQQAEVWTLCRILKRNTSLKKCIPDWREIAAKRITNTASSPNNKAFSDEEHSDYYCNNRQAIISFSCANNNNNPVIWQQNHPDDQKTMVIRPSSNTATNVAKRVHHQLTMSTAAAAAATHQHQQQEQPLIVSQIISSSLSSHHQTTPSTSSYTSFMSSAAPDVNEVSKRAAAAAADWDELRSVVEFASSDPFIF